MGGVVTPTVGVEGDRITGWAYDTTDGWKQEPAARTGSRRTPYRLPRDRGDRHVRARRPHPQPAPPPGRRPRLPLGPRTAGRWVRSCGPGRGAAPPSRGPRRPAGAPPGASAVDLAAGTGHPRTATGVARVVGAASGPGGAAPHRPRTASGRRLRPGARRTGTPARPLGGTPARGPVARDRDGAGRVGGPSAVARTLDVLGRVGSITTIAAMLVLSAALAGLADGTPPSGAAAEVAVTTLR